MQIAVKCEEKGLMPVLCTLLLHGIFSYPQLSTFLVYLSFKMSELFGGFFFLFYLSLSLLPSFFICFGRTANISGLLFFTPLQSTLSFSLFFYFCWLCFYSVWTRRWINKTEGGSRFDKQDLSLKATVQWSLFDGAVFKRRTCTER